MDEALRRAWTEIVTPDDYEEHMARIGQAQAGADLTRHLLETARPSPGGRVVFAGAGTGQMLDFLDAVLLRPFHLIFTDLNARFLEFLRRRLSQLNLAADVIEDDFENTALEPAPDLLIATLLLENIDWRRGIETISDLRPAACGIIMQENPPGMKSAITPGRELPRSMAEAASQAHPVLVPYEHLIPAFAAHCYQQIDTSSRDVADGKHLVSVLFRLSSLPTRTRTMTPEDFRRIALSLEGAEEGSHMGAVDFRVGGRIFATLASVDQGYGNLMLDPEQQATFVEEMPDVFLPIHGGWGRMGATHIRLAKASKDVLTGALQTAWKLRVEKNAKTSRGAKKASVNAKPPVKKKATVPPRAAKKLSGRHRPSR